MAWNDVANNQCVSRSNLSNAISNGVFQQKNSFTSDGREITKSTAADYIYLNPNKASYSAKSSDQLVVKSDLEAAWAYCMGYDSSSKSQACIDYDAYCGCFEC